MDRIKTRLCAAVVLSLILAAASWQAQAGPAVGQYLPAAVRVEMRDGQGTALRSITGTLIRSGAVVPISALAGAASAVVETRGGESWTAENVIAANPVVDLAVLQLPQEPEAALAFPTSGAFTPGGTVTVLVGPGMGADSVATELYYTFALRDGTEFIAASNGVAGAAPILDHTGRFLGVSSVFQEAGYTLGYAVPMASVAVVAGAGGTPIPITAVGQTPPADYLSHDNAVGLAFRGAILTTARKGEDARNFLGVALKKDPASVDAHFWMGKVLMLDEQYTEAAEEFQKATAADPAYHMGWHMAGVAFNQAGRYLDAEKMYKKALDVKPTSAESWCNLGGAYFNQRRYDKAIEAFQKSIEFDPRYAQGLAHSNLAMTYVTVGRRAEAEKIYQDLLKSFPATAKRLRSSMDGGR